MRSNAIQTMVRAGRIFLTMTPFGFACVGLPAYAALGAVPGIPTSLVCKIDPSVNESDRGTKTSVVCDYRYDPTFKPSQLTLEVAGAKIKLGRDNIKKYPSEGQKTALLAMFDVSDPRRNATTTGLYPKIVEALAENRPAHLVLGVATFSQSLDIALRLQPLKKTTNLDTMPFSAMGAATELNRAALAALRKLAEENADRKILLVVSDGKAEDTAYKLADVIAEAQKLRIPIATVGIAERPSETPSLQSLRLLAEQSSGTFFDFSDKKIPTDFRSRLLGLVEIGGRVSFDGSVFHGKRLVSVTLTDAEKKALTAQAELEFPDLRGWGKKIVDFLTTYWWMVAGGAIAAVGVAWAAFRYRRTRRERELQNRVVAEFRGLDDGETRYEVRKPAVTLGRAIQNDIVLSNSSVSGRHAELHRTRAGGFRLSDLGSTNGTLVNGARITAVDLKDGDLVEIAEVHLRFKISD